MAEAARERETDVIVVPEREGERQAATRPELSARGHALVTSDLAKSRGGTSDPEQRAAVLAVQREAGNQPVAALLGATPERENKPPETQERRAARSEWYIEVDPPTSVVTVGSEVTFRLHPAGPSIKWRAPPLEPHWPVVTITDERGATTASYASPETGPHGITGPPQKSVTFDHAGSFQIAFSGTAVRGTGPPEAPFALTDEGPVHVWVYVDAVPSLGPEQLEAAQVQRTAREDLARFEDPQATRGEIAQAFKRIAVRRGLQILNANRKEAEDLLQLYTTGSGGQTAEAAAEEVRQVLELDAKLFSERFIIDSHYEAKRVARAEGRDLKTREEVAAYREEKVEQIKTARLLLADAFPAIALMKKVGYRTKQFQWEEPSERLSLLQVLVKSVIKTIDDVKEALVTGDVDVFDLDVLVQQVSDELGINEHRQGVLDEAMRLHRHVAMVRSLGLAVVAIALLFVPGIGPFLAAGVGASTAAISMERAMDLWSAAGAGLHGGLVSDREANSAMFWALIEVLTAGLDVGTAVKGLSAAKVAPHVPAATERAVVGTARATGRTIEQVLPRAAEAGEKSVAMAMTAEDLHDLVTRLFRRPVAPMKGQVRFWADEAAYAADWAKLWKRVTGKAPTGRPPAGFFHPSSGINVAPGRGLMTAVHEAVHKVAQETFPTGRLLLGDFLDEGITEAIVQGALGPRPQPVYARNVQFVGELEKVLGQDVVRNAVLHGDYRGLRDAVKRVLGGSEQETFQFFSMLRGVGSKPTVAEERVLEEALEMLQGRTKAAPGTQLHVPEGSPGVKGPSAEEVEAAVPEGVKFAKREDFLKALQPVFPGHALEKALAIVDEIGEKAAVEVIKDPRFLQAVKSKNWTLAGTLFHSAARRQGVALTAGVKGYQFEFVLLPGPGGSRLDIVIRDAQGFIIEIDWKTTGRSAISYGARKEMKKHAATATQDLTKLGGPIGEQLSKSWVDFVRPHLPGVEWPK